MSTSRRLVHDAHLCRRKSDGILPAIVISFHGERENHVSTLRLGAVLSLSAALCAAPVWADAPQEATLANGLKVVVKVDRRAPVAVSQLWYR